MRDSLRPALKGLSTVLFFIAILSGLLTAFGLIVGFAEEDPSGFMAAFAGMAGVLTAMLGRVVIYMAVVLEDIANAMRAPQANPYRTITSP